MKTLYLTTIIVLVISTMVTTSVFAQNATNSTNSITQHNAAQPFPRNLVTPLKQLQMGIQAQNVICDWSGFELILKSEDGSPACVSSQTAQILMERGWGHFPLRLR